MDVLWEVAPCIPVDTDHYFRGASCLQNQGNDTWCNIAEKSHFQLENESEVLIPIPDVPDLHILEKHYDACYKTSDAEGQYNMELMR